MLAGWQVIPRVGGLCSTGVVTRLGAHGAALLPPLLVGAPSDLRSAPPLVMLTGVSTSGIEGDPPWALA